LPAGEHGFWGKGVRIIGDIASADKEGNYSVLSGGRLVFHRVQERDEHGDPTAWSKALYATQIVTGTARPGETIDLYAKGYTFLQEPIVLAYYRSITIPGRQNSTLPIRKDAFAANKQFDPETGAFSFTIHSESYLGDYTDVDLAVQNMKIQSTGTVRTWDLGPGIWEVSVQEKYVVKSTLLKRGRLKIAVEIVDEITGEIYDGYRVTLIAPVWGKTTYYPENNMDLYVPHDKKCKLVARGIEVYPTDDSYWEPIKITARTGSVRLPTDNDAIVWMVIEGGDFTRDTGLIKR